MSERSNNPSGAEAAISRRNRMVGAATFGIAFLMLGAAYAAVPLYDLFCRVTGFGGKPLYATALGGAPIAHPITVRFDTNIAPGLKWRVTPDVSQVTVNPGEPQTVLYKVENLSDEPVTAMAAYNVAPTTVGQFFNKLQCFCFSQQTLRANETTEFAVVFFLDPAIANDAEEANTREIVLSYTFYKQKLAASPLAALPQPNTQN